MPGFSGQGKVEIGTAQTVNGILQPGLLRWIGNAAKFSVQMDEKASQRNESFSGSRLPFRRLTQSRAGKISISFDEFNKDNNALALVASVTQVSAGTAVTAYAFPTGAKVGSVLAPPAKNLTAVAVKDSAGTPATLVAGTDYDIDLFSGSVTLKNLGAYVQPFKMDYTPGAITKVGALNQAATDLYIRFNGINTDDGSRLVADLFRCRLSPTKEFQFIGDDYQDFSLEGDVLVDVGRPASSADGQFFTLVTS
jgi:hypothetical protein